MPPAPTLFDRPAGHAHMRWLAPSDRLFRSCSASLRRGRSGRAACSCLAAASACSLSLSAAAMPGAPQLCALICVASGLSSAASCAPWAAPPQASSRLWQPRAMAGSQARCKAIAPLAAEGQGRPGATAHLLPELALPVHVSHLLAQLLQGPQAGAGHHVMLPHAYRQPPLAPAGVRVRACAQAWPRNCMV